MVYCNKVILCYSSLLKHFLLNIYFFIKMYTFYLIYFPRSIFITYYKIVRSQKSTDCRTNAGPGLMNQWSGASRFKVQGSLLFVTYTIIQGIISSEMLEFQGLQVRLLKTPCVWCMVLMNQRFEQIG